MANKEVFTSKAVEASNTPEVLFIPIDVVDNQTALSADRYKLILEYVASLLCRRGVQTDPRVFYSAIEGEAILEVSVKDFYLEKRLDGDRGNLCWQNDRGVRILRASEFFDSFRAIEKSFSVNGELSQRVVDMEITFRIEDNAGELFRLLIQDKKYVRFSGRGQVQGVSRETSGVRVQCKRDVRANFAI